MADADTGGRGGPRSCIPRCGERSPDNSDPPTLTCCETPDTLFELREALIAAADCATLTGSPVALPGPSRLRGFAITSTLALPGSTLFDSVRAAGGAAGARSAVPASAAAGAYGSTCALRPPPHASRDVYAPPPPPDAEPEACEDGGGSCVRPGTYARPPRGLLDDPLRPAPMAAAEGPGCAAGAACRTGTFTGRLVLTVTFDASPELRSATRRFAASAKLLSSVPPSPESSSEIPWFGGLPTAHATRSLKDPTDSALRRAGMVTPMVAEDIRLPDPAAIDLCDRDSFDARMLSRDVSGPGVLSTLGFRRVDPTRPGRGRCRIADVSPTFCAAVVDGVVSGRGGRNNAGDGSASAATAALPRLSSSTGAPAVAAFHCIRRSEAARVVLSLCSAKLRIGAVDCTLQLLVLSRAGPSADAWFNSASFCARSRTTPAVSRGAVGGAGSSGSRWMDTPPDDIPAEWLLGTLGAALLSLPDAWIRVGRGSSCIWTRGRVRGLGLVRSDPPALGGAVVRGDTRGDRRGDRRSGRRGDGLAAAVRVPSEDEYSGRAWSGSLSASSARRMLADVSMDGHARPNTASEQLPSDASGMVHGTETELGARADDADIPAAHSLAESMKELGVGVESAMAVCWSAGRKSGVSGWKWALLCTHAVPFQHFGTSELGPLVFEAIGAHKGSIRERGRVTAWVRHSRLSSSFAPFATSPQHKPHFGGNMHVKN